MRFAEDKGDDPPEFVRYNSCLYTWAEFVEEFEAQGLTQYFLAEYVMSLPLEVIPVRA